MSIEAGQNLLHDRLIEKIGKGRKAGIENRLVHDLRRTAVRNLERAGVSRSVAMKPTGHKTEAVYRRHAIVSVTDLSDGVKKLDALLKMDLSEPRRVLPYSPRKISYRPASCGPRLPYYHPSSDTVLTQFGRFARTALRTASL